MPRTGRGGQRSGNPGANYANRTDLTLPAPPNQAATGQEYGTAGQQEARMRAVPVAAPPGPGGASPPIPGAGVGAPPGGAPTPPGVAFPGNTSPAVAPLRTPVNPPPPEGLLAAPTARPNEPLTAGLPTGAGPGPEALVNGWGTGASGVGEQTTGQLLRALASRPGAGSTLQAMADIAASNQRS